MKHLIFSLLFIATSLNLRGQDTIILKNNARMILDTTNMRTIPQFEEDLKLIDMKFIPSAQYDIFYDINLVSPCKEQDCPFKKIGLIHAILTSHDKQCKLFVYIAGAINAHLGDIIKYNKKSFGIDTLSKYNRVKHDFDYGRPYSSASEQDIEDLKIMMTFYPQDTARSFFNADYMMTYPYNMKGKACQGVYSRTRVVVIERNGLDFFFYFTMTDVGIKDFDKYLMDLKGVLGFNAMTRQDGH